MSYGGDATVLPSSPGRSGLRLRRPVLVVVVGVVALALVAGAIARFRGDGPHRVLLTVDGEPLVVTSEAGTVGELLAAQGVAVSGKDRVAPAAGTPLADAPTVEVAYARPVRLTLDGETTTVTTTAHDVAGLLAAEGLPAGSATSLAAVAELPRTGAEIVVTTPKAVTVHVDGTDVPLTTTATTVGEALAGDPVGLTPTDQVSVARDAAVTDGASYRVTRVDVVDDVRRTVLRADTRWVQRASLATGTTQVLEPGHDGLRVREVRLRYEDGDVVRRHVLTDRVQSRPVTWVIAVGTGSGAGGSSTPITYERNWTPATGKADGAPDFAALAKCESGGNPRAVSPTGKYRGLYQFDLRTWHGVGGVGDPIDATPQEQTKRARILYNDRGRTPWPYCGRYL